MGMFNTHLAAVDWCVNSTICASAAAAPTLTRGTLSARTTYTNYRLVAAASLDVTLPEFSTHSSAAGPGPGLSLGGPAIHLVRTPARSRQRLPWMRLLS